MRQRSPAPYGAATEAAGIVLFVAGTLVIGDRPGFDAVGAEIDGRVGVKMRSRVRGGGGHGG